ncbi:MAG TPA: alpha/beta hydrolase [Acidimicrobiales bacterium]|nr:alpha/beta hydrolase [Acidimicrobiales bacterium]
MTLPEKTQALVDELSARYPAPDFSALTPDEEAAYILSSRANTSVPATGGESVAKVVDTTTGPFDVPARVYVPDRTTLPGAVVLYFHGGGWTLGSVEMSDGLCRYVANRSGCVVVSSTYRLAPEYPFPAAADDAFDALRWVVEHASEYGADPTRIAVMGSSAGGNLAASVCVRARDEGGPPIALQVLLYPVIDSSMASKSFHNYAEGCFLTAAQMRWHWGKYAPDPAQRSHPYASPAFTDDLAGLPPAIVVTAEFDPLRDEGETYAQRLIAAHVPAKMFRAKGQLHSFLTMLGVLPEANLYADMIASRLSEI